MTVKRIAPLLALIAVLAFGASAAHAEESLSPWWHLTTSSRPSYLQPGKARDEVQRVHAGTVEAEGAGLYGYESFGTHDEEQSAVVEGTPEQAQKALEGLYGAGNVEVMREPSFEEYEVKFVGELADQPVEVMKSCGAFLCATTTELAKGRPDGEIVVDATNLGDAAVNPETNPVTIADELPKGLEAVGLYGAVNQTLKYVEFAECSLKTVSCTFAHQPFKGVENVAPAHQLQILIAVNLKAGAVFGEVNKASIAGGGAPPATTKSPVTVSGAPMPFAVNAYEIRPEEAGGAPDTQAGSHPFQLTTTLNFNEKLEERVYPAGGSIPFLSKPAGGSAKDLYFKLPAGLVGNPTAIAACPLGTFLQAAANASAPQCPPDTVVGFAMPNAFVTESFSYEGPIQEPLYNVEPAVGEPARFGFGVYGDPVLLDTSVRTGSDYGVTVSATNITQTAELIGSEVTFWGVPGDPRHDQQRCRSAIEGFASCPALNQSNPPPFLSLPTSCTGPMATSVEGDSWAQKAQRDFEHLPLEASPLAGSDIGALDGCNRLPLSGQIKVTPDVQEASKPSGLSVDVHVPQDSVLVASGLAESNIKDITVTLPEGLDLNPSAADGLQACSNAQIGFTGMTELNPASLPGVRTVQFTPGEPSCPNASKIATVTIHSPLLPNPLKGFVYLAAPQNFRNAPPENPFESLVAMYLVAKDPVSGTLVKLSGSVSLNEATGQVTSTFANNPQLPFEDAELSFFGGERAPLATPSHCGAYTTQASFTPWSGNPAIGSSSQFNITSGPGGGPCPGSSLPFSPTLSSETTNINAGSFTPLSTTLGREDGQQSIQSVTLHYPPGVSGLLSGVKLCPEAQANAGTCGPESQIGETIVSVGLGGDPFTVTGGKAYITEHYAGAPFGLSIVNPAAAGPFNLQQGRPVVVRAKIEINPITAALTVTAGPIPTIIEGFPLQIKHVNVNVNRPNFTFNPTNCNPMQITGTINSAEGASSPVQDPFQVTNCQALHFAPKFAVSTSGKTSKAKGASLHVSLTYPGPFNSYANIARAKVELPKQLPSRLTTLQKACTNAQFELNPANCPKESMIGYAKAVTPLLPVPLEGPAIFVSHGGEAFPSLEFVLQGYGVTIDLVGTTFISKSGVTSTTFKQVPDQPVTSFELTLPEGKYSALAANGNLCTQKLVMPNEFIGQNGAAIHQVTPIAVTGCKKTRALTRAQKLAKAMKACHKKAKGKRAACEAKARKQFGAVKKPRTKKK